MTDKEFYRSIGICPYCRKEKLLGKEKMCPECLAYFSKKNCESYKKNRAKNRDRDNEKHRMIYAKKSEEGICVSCNKLKAMTGRKRCYLCLEKNRISSMLRREKLNGNKDC